MPLCKGEEQKLGRKERAAVPPVGRKLMDHLPPHQLIRTADVGDRVGIEEKMDQCAVDKIDFASLISPIFVVGFPDDSGAENHRKIFG